MILLRERLRDPIHRNGEKRIKRGDHAEPPRDDQRAARTLGNIHHALRDILGGEVRIFDAPNRFARLRAFEFIAELGDRGTGINARNFYAEVTHFAAEGVGESARTEFAGGIRCDGRRGDETRNGNHVDDVTFAAFEHMRDHRARDKHRADQVDADERFDVAFGFEILEPVDRAIARIVEEDVDFAVEVERGLHHHFDLGAFVHIGRDRERFAAFALNFSRKRLQAVEPTRGEDDFASFLRKQFRGVFAKARRRAGDEDDFVFEGDRHGYRVRQQVGSIRNTKYAV